MVRVVVGIWIRAVRGREDVPHVLVARRAPAERFYPGCWEHPGGKVEGQESPEDTIRREWSEELPDVHIERVTEAYPAILLPLPDRVMACQPVLIQARWATEAVGDEVVALSWHTLGPHTRAARTPNHDALRWVPTRAADWIGDGTTDTFRELQGSDLRVPSYPWIARWL